MKAFLFTLAAIGFSLLVYAVWTSDAGAAVEIGLL